MQRNRLTAVLLHFLHLFDRHVELARKLVRRGFTAEVLQHLALHTRKFVDHFDHVHGHADGACLIGHGSSDGLANPPRRVGGELEAFLPIEFLDGADQTEIAFLDQIEEQHAAAGVALGQRHHESQVGLQQVVLGAASVVRGPFEFALALEVHLVGFGVQQMLGVQSGFDAFGKVDFLLRVQQAHAADLLEVVLDRIGGGAGRDHTALRIARWRQIVVVIVVAHHESALLLGHFRLLALFLVVIVLFGLGFLLVIDVVAIVGVDVTKVVEAVVEISVVDFGVLIVEGSLLKRFLLALLGRGTLLRGRLARGLRGGGLPHRAFPGRGLACGGFFRGGGLFSQTSLFRACRRFLGGQTYPS